MAACLPLAAWTLQNGWRYGDYTLARGGNAVVPFYRTFVLDKTVSPTNGPASRRLAAAIQQHLLTRDPYKADRITLKQVLSSGSSRVHEDLYILSDRVFGWNSAYSTLRDAAWEAIKAHPGTYASSVADTVWQQLSNPVYSTRSQYTPTTPAATGNGARLPAPTNGELIPAGQTAWISRPDQSIRELWTSPTTHTFVFLKPGQKARFGQITHDLSTLASNFPHRSGDASLQHRLNQLAYRYPPPIFWLLVGLIALLVRRPRGTKALATLTSAALTIIAFNALAQSANPRYMLPVVPAFILLAAAALLGHTRPPDPTH